MTPNAIILALALSRAFTSLFDRHDPRVPPSFAAIRARYECVTLHGVRIDRSNVTGDEATADLTVDATGFLPLTRVTREFPPHWHAHFKRQANGWQVDGVSVPEAALAQQLAEGKAIGAEQAELIDGELVRQLCDLAFATNAKGDYGKAASDAELALAIAREAAPLEMPRALWLIGRAHDSAGDEDGAIAPLEEARTLAARYRDREMEERALIGIAWFHLNINDRAGMTEPLNAGLAIAESLGDHSAAAEGYLASANDALFGREDLMGALPAYQQALRHATRAGNLVLQAAILGNIGSVYDKLANYRMSASYFTRAVALYRKAGNTKGVIRNLRNLAEVEQSANHLISASRYAREIDRLLLHEPNPRTAAFAALTWAKILTQQGQYALAEKKGREAIEGAKASDNPALVTHVKYLLSNIRFKQHRYRESIDFANQAIADCLVTPNFDIYWNAKAQAGIAWMALGDLQKARAELQDAVDAVESRNSNVPGSGENEQLYWSEKAGVYYAMFRLALKSHDTESALAYVERARARSLLASLAIGKMKSTRDLSPEEQREEQQIDASIAATNVALRDARSDDHPDAAAIARLQKELDQKRVDRTDLTNRLYTSHPELSLARGDVPTPSLAQLRAAIPPDGVVLEYVIDTETAALVVLTHSGEPRVYPIHTTQMKLKDDTEALTAAIARRDLEFKPAARRLYDLLLAPAARELQSKKIVCFVTDGVLWGLPFQALLGPDGRYFMEDHSLFYAPSLTFVSWYSAHKRSGPRERTLLAVAGSQLLDAETEVHRIASLFPARETLVLTGSRATESRFKQEAGRFRILHVATHGTFENLAPMFSHIDMAPDAENDGVLEAREIAGLDLHADLAILSSCESARGPYRMGEGMVGISWALLSAGCPRSVLTQWKIASASSRDLMIDFHRRLAARPTLTGRAATDALHGAQLHMLKRSAFAHPFYWSAFILIGDGW
jgi:CHAT domain-containing protein